MSDTALYLLGFSHLNRGFQDISSLLSSYGVECIDHDSVRAWVRPVERAEFEGPMGEKNLSDIQWLTPRVMAHDMAVSLLSQSSEFLPSRFGVLFSNPQTLVRLISEERNAIDGFFERTRGKSEWGLKVFVRTDIATELYRKSLPSTGLEKPLTGAHYLKLKQQQRSQENAVKQWTIERANAIVDMLETQIPEMVVRSLPKSDGLEGRVECVANLAFLFDSQGRSLVDDCLKQLGEWMEPLSVEEKSRPFAYEITGPWPCYSYCPPLLGAASSEADTAQ